MAFITFFTPDLHISTDGAGRRSGPSPRLEKIKTEKKSKAKVSNINNPLSLQTQIERTG